ncbi:MAG TPA: 23S rRNA (pseudouridine(1915)-N(3))-methyltransferase RlmH [Burkholderiaceae bacterium]|nr:23S rRNA (pseudouridine(1915)-N(3))-methyltransferase RlmH [Burkholderiaceae bacterium]HQR69750.1 23S rRNA (pseudouridine(1915)-N(3))-methyltransferase RlmH [Burkholderiaceae bacterium]
MKILILAVGQRQPAWVDAAVNDYLARFPADFKVELRELKAEPRTGRADEAERCRSAESGRLRAAVPAGSQLIALDERGKDWTTQQLAEQLGGWRDGGDSVTFAIGGPDGLDEGFRREARLLLRLSSMTLPHALARVLLAEQLYRAWSILARHPYHRA